MKKIFFMVLCAGCMLTGCVKDDVVDLPFDASKIEAEGISVTEAGITSYVVSNGKTYDVLLNNVTAVEPQEKLDTVSVDFSEIQAIRLFNATYNAKISTEKVANGIEKNKEMYRIRADFRGVGERIPFYFVTEKATINGLPMPYPELTFEIRNVVEEELPDIKKGEDEWYASILTFNLDVKYEGITIPLSAKVVATEKKIPIMFDPSVDNWQNVDTDIDI